MALMTIVTKVAKAPITIINISEDIKPLKKQVILFQILELPEQSYCQGNRITG